MDNNLNKKFQKEPAKYTKYNKLKSDLDFNKLVVYEPKSNYNINNFKSGKISVKPSVSERIVTLSSEVCCQVRKFICLNKELQLYNKIDYNSTKNYKIKDMSKNDEMLRKALLDQRDEEEYYYIFKPDIDFLHNEFKSAQVNLNLKEGEIEKFSDGYIYYEIIIKYIILFNTIPAPSKIELMEECIKSCIKEVRYYCNKKMFQKAIKWANDTRAKLFQSESNVLTKNIKETSKTLLDKILLAYKPNLMNKCFALIELEPVVQKSKSEITDKDINLAKEKDYSEAIKTIDEFRLVYTTINDDYLKMTLRKVNCLLKLRNFEVAKNELELLQKNKEKFSKNIVGEIESATTKLNNEMKSVEKDKVNKDDLFKKNFKKNMFSNKEDIDIYKWYPVTKDLNEDPELEKDTIFFAFN